MFITLKCSSQTVVSNAIIFLLPSAQVELNKPVYIGQAVLDLSKLIMYKLRYETLAGYAQFFGGEITIAGGDTDSFFLSVKGISLRDQLLPKMAQDGLLDTSNYPKHDPLYSTERKAKLGCIKDEAGGRRWREWIFLRPKCYAMKEWEPEGGENKRAKGVRKTVLKKHIHFDDYKVS